MNNVRIIQPLCSISLAALCLFASAAQAQTALPDAPSASANAPKDGMQSGMMNSTDMKQSMKAGMDGMQQMQTSGDTDKDFAMMMKMHHQQALDMAEVELADGKSAELKSMARKIITGQKKEIAQFDSWLAKQK
jgi:uncharacterized protein (DUF305 family)